MAAIEVSELSKSFHVVGSICGAAVLVGFLVAMGALTLFIGGRGEQADLGFQAILILASYPLDVFGGATKLLLFTVVPAAFVTGLPTALVDDFNVGTSLGLVTAAAAFAGLDWEPSSLGCASTRRARCGRAPDRALTTRRVDLKCLATHAQRRVN